MNTLIRIGLATAPLLVFARMSDAKLLTWYLQDVKAANGDAVHGYFELDPAKEPPDRSPPTWDIDSNSVVTRSRDPGAFSWAFEEQGEDVIFLINLIDLGGKRYDSGFHFYTKTPLPSDGGTVSLAEGGDERVCYGPLDGETGCQVYSLITSGKVTTNPIPEPAPFVFLGMAAVALMIRINSRRH